MKRIMNAVMAAAVVLLAGNGVAYAAVDQMVNIDIQGGYLSGKGVGPILTNGYDFYRTYADPAGATSTAYVTESSGSLSNGMFTYSSDAMTAINSKSGLSSAMASTAYKKLFDGYMNADTARTLTITGLDASKSYEMVVYSQRETGQNTSLYINGSQVISNSSDLTALTQATAANDYDGNYAIIDGLTTNASGVLSFTYQGQIDAFQIKELAFTPEPEPVPEPASVVLLGVGGLLGAFGLRRSREKATE